MGDLTGDADFRVESRESRFVFRKRFRQKFDGENLAQPQVFSTIHFTHAATP
jgi:hypothetical protein